MAEKRIKFTVKKNGAGAFTVETKDGFVGADCTTELEAIIGGIGAKVTSQGDKEEMYQEKPVDAWVDRIS